MADVTIREARSEDIGALVPLMQDFYQHERLPWDEARTRGLLAELIEDAKRGRVLLFGDGGEIVGYLVLTFGYSLEFHGRDALIDEFYVMEAKRGSGIGTKALKRVAEICGEENVVAVHLEADHQNVRAYDFYQQQGFKPHQRHLMTWWLKERT
jgi:ribosomal protein S18 acetylase RimI-like enzyme